jgi:hypothetical protein
LDILKIYSKRSFWIITIFGVLIAGGLNAGLYFGIDWALQNFSKGVAQEVVSENISWVIGYIELAGLYFYKAVVPSVAALILILCWLAWGVLRGSVSGVLKMAVQDVAQDSGKGKKDFIDQKIEQDRRRRLFLHTLSVLQREGRLLDFFDEDLSLYDDAQIGAAVRSIQEDCKKTVKKYIDPQPVIEKEEGDTVVIEDGFDIDSIKLIGKVSGKPPFEGVLKHRGWKAGKKEIPKLSDIQDSTIIIPAEVEIQ